MDDQQCSKCGSYAARIRRKPLQKLLQRGSRRYRCRSCHAVYLILKDGSRREAD